MKKLLTIRMFILLMLLPLIIFSWETVLNTFILFYYFILLLFTDCNSALHQVNFTLLDYFFSAFTVTGGVLVLLLGWFLKSAGGGSFRNKSLLSFRKPQVAGTVRDLKISEWGITTLLNSPLTLTAVFLVLLAIAFLFAPLVATSNPDFQKNINVTKLLPPLSTVIEITSLKNSTRDNRPQFFFIKDKVIKNSFNDKVTFALTKPILTDAGYDIKEKHFLLGTDEYGRDIWSRLIYGARVSITIGILSVLITSLLGIISGFFAGYKGGVTDSLLNRFSDMLLSFPLIFLIILIIALFGNSVISVIIVLGFSGWMSLFKIVRSEVISIKGKDYFLTAKLMGLGSRKLIFAEMLPVIAAPVVVNLVFQFGNVVLAESALSYLGLGTGGVYPSWGSMIQSGQSYLNTAWWMILFPGLALFLTLLLTNNLGSSIKSFFNPGLRK